MYLEPQTTIYKWMFQLDDSQSLHENGCFTKHPFINGCLGFQVRIYNIQTRKVSHICLSTSIQFWWTEIGLRDEPFFPNFLKTTLCWSFPQGVPSWIFIPMFEGTFPAKKTSKAPENGWLGVTEISFRGPGLKYSPACLCLGAKKAVKFSGV